MTKFKVGDKVRVLDSSNIPDYAGKWIPVMKKYIGKIGDIERIDHYTVKKELDTLSISMMDMYHSRTMKEVLNSLRTRKSSSLRGTIQ